MSSNEDVVVPRIAELKKCQEYLQDIMKFYKETSPKDMDLKLLRLFEEVNIIESAGVEEVESMKQQVLKEIKEANIIVTKHYDDAPKVIAASNIDERENAAEECGSSVTEMRRAFEDKLNVEAKTFDAKVEVQIDDNVADRVETECVAMEIEAEPKIAIAEIITVDKIEAANLDEDKSVEITNEDEPYKALPINALKSMFEPSVDKKPDIQNESELETAVIQICPEKPIIEVQEKTLWDVIHAIKSGIDEDNIDGILNDVKALIATINEELTSGAIVALNQCLFACIPDDSKHAELRDEIKILINIITERNDYE